MWMNRDGQQFQTTFTCFVKSSHTNRAANKNPAVIPNQHDMPSQYTTNLGLYGPSGKFHNAILALWGTVRQILFSLRSSKQHSQCQLGSLSCKTYTTFLTSRPPIFHNNIQRPQDLSSCLWFTELWLRIFFFCKYIFFTNNFYRIKYAKSLAFLETCIFIIKIFME